MIRKANRFNEYNRSNTLKNNYKLENILFPEKRSFRKKDLDDRIMLGDVNNPDYRTVLTNGKYFYATDQNIVDFINDTGINTLYTEKLPKYAANNIFRLTSSNKSNQTPLNKLNIEINGDKFIVTDNNDDTLYGYTKDLKTIKALFVNTPRNIQTFFVPYDDDERVFLCLQADGEFGTLMLER